jgi:hypothetical protein
VRVLLAALLGFIVLAQPAHAVPTVSLNVDKQPTTGVSGAPLDAIFIIATDSSAVSGLAITAAIASGPGGATLGGTNPLTTDAEGAVIFGLTITGPDGDYTLTFSAPGATTVTSSPITISAVPVVPVLSITGQPSATAVSGTPFALQPTLEAVDRDSGSRSPVQDLAITAAIASGPGGASLSGVTTQTTDTNGDVNFGDLVITGPAGTYALSFSADGATTVTSDAIIVSVAPGPAPDPDPQPDPAPAPVVNPTPDETAGMLTLALPLTIECAFTGAGTELWMRLPAPQECSFVGGRALTSAQLLGWATTPDFPLALALRQIENGWGAYESMGDGRITAVFIRAGGWTAQTAPGQLYPVLDIDALTSAHR